MRRPGTQLPGKGQTVSNDIIYLLNVAPREAYIDDLMDGHLYMNAADYYHCLPRERGDPLEASMVPVHASMVITACPSAACTQSVRTI